MEQKYYDIIIKSIKENKRYVNMESILDKIAENVYERSKTVLETVTDESVLYSYIEKTVTTSLITVPKRLNFSSEKNYESFNKKIDTDNAEQIQVEKNDTKEIANNDEIYLNLEKDLEQSEIEFDNTKEKPDVNKDLIDKVINGNSVAQIEFSTLQKGFSQSETVENITETEVEETLDMVEDTQIEELESSDINETSAIIETDETTENADEILTDESETVESITETEVEETLDMVEDTHIEELESSDINETSAIIETDETAENTDEILTDESEINSEELLTLDATEETDEAEEILTISDEVESLVLNEEYETELTAIDEDEISFDNTESDSISFTDNNYLQNLEYNANEYTSRIDAQKVISEIYKFDNNEATNKYNEIWKLRFTENKSVSDIATITKLTETDVIIALNEMTELVEGY